MIADIMIPCPDTLDVKWPMSSNGDGTEVGNLGLLPAEDLENGGWRWRWLELSWKPFGAAINWMITLMTKKNIDAYHLYMGSICKFWEWKFLT